MSVALDPRQHEGWLRKLFHNEGCWIANPADCADDTCPQVLSIKGRKMLSEARASELAENAFPFIAGDPELVSALLAVSGIQVGDLRRAASEPGFELFLLDFILQQDDRVLAYAASLGVRPEAVGYARDLLAHRRMS